MAVDLWPGPGYLPQTFAAANFGHMLADGVISDDYKLGPPVYRRRTTSAPENITGQMFMTTAEWETLYTFFHTTLFDGVMRFLMPPQGATDEARYWVCRFIKPPTRQMTEADDLWSVMLALEKLGIAQGFVSPGAMTEPDTFYAPRMIFYQILQQEFGGTFFSPNTFYVPTVSASGGVAQSVLPGVVSNIPDTFYAPTVVPEGGPQTLTPSLLSNIPDTFYVPSIMGGNKTISPPLYSATNTFYAPKVGRSRIYPARYTDTDIFYAPAIITDSDVYSFNMTAGSFSGIVFGYGDGTSQASSITIGSIDAEPFPFNALARVFSGSIKTVTFHGNVLAQLTGLNVYVGGVSYAAGSLGWSYSGGGTDTTQLAWVSGGPTFANGISYFIEIK